MKTTLERGPYLVPRQDGSQHDAAVHTGTVLVPMLNMGVANDMIQLAGIMAAGSHQRTGAPSQPATGNPKPRVVVVSVVEVPADQPLVTGLVLARSYRALLDFLPSEVDAGGVQVRIDRIVKVARDVASAVHEAALDEGADTLLLHWKGYARRPKRHTFGAIADSILRNPPCNVALVRPEGWRESRRIVLPVRGGPAAEQALQIALGVAEVLHLPLTVMHTVPRAEADSDAATSVTNLVEARGEEPYIIFNEQLNRAVERATVPIERILTVGGDPALTLLAEARRSDMVIMGAPPQAEYEQTPGEQGLKSPSLRVAEEKGPPILLLHTAESIDLASYRRKVRSHHVHLRKQDMLFEHWFVENTYHGDEFRDPEAFMEAKRHAGQSISVALLTSNDSSHIYSTIVGLKRVLMEMHPIADQIAVIDANSSDGTADIARSLGVDVYTCDDILPEKGNLHGRGESWWKSLSVLTGDIIVWLDPRARRFHPSTAMSLAGPLLRVPTLQMVKAYGQPHRDKHHTHTGRDGHRADYSPIDMSWGGFVVPPPGADLHDQRIRVQAFKPDDLQTLEASVIASLPPRTILQVLCPPLAAVLEPFGRDMAGRREAMLSLPAFAGDNLEIGLLLSVAAEYGTRSIAQVELHHAQPAPGPQAGLRNALDLLQALSRRLQDSYTRRCAAETAERLQHAIDGTGTRNGQSELLEVRALGPVERPPMRPILEISHSA